MFYQNFPADCSLPARVVYLQWNAGTSWLANHRNHVTNLCMYTQLSEPIGIFHIFILHYMENFKTNNNAMFIFSFTNHCWEFNAIWFSILLFKLILWINSNKKNLLLLIKPIYQIYTRWRRTTISNLLYQVNIILIYLNRHLPSKKYYYS